ncbi:hypothetical protein SGCOL_007669 [Colletotrichum sp. CLE4]
MSSIENPAVPKGLIAVITGANGYIASHIADHFIQNGYRVRGTVRNPKKSAWLVPHFEIRYGTGKFELHIVPDMQVDAVYDEAIKGVSILVHTATVLDSNGDPAEVIGGAVTCGMVAIQAAYKEQTAILPDVKGERIFAFAYPMNWDIVLDIFRRQNPGRKFADNFHDEEYPVTVKPVARAEGILKRLGRPGWISLEQSIATNTEHLQATKDA